MLKRNSIFRIFQNSKKALFDALVVNVWHRQEKHAPLGVRQRADDVVDETFILGDLVLQQGAHASLENLVA